MDGQNYRCPACLETFQEGTACPHCGFDGSRVEQAPFLKIGSVLNARYRVGRVQSSNGEGAVYLAFDKEKKAKVFVREFFPQSVCSRSADGVSVAVLAGGEEAFVNGKQQFQLLAGQLNQHPQAGVLPVLDSFAEHNTVYSVLQHCPGGTLRQLAERKGSPLSWNQSKRIFLPVIDGLAALHALNIGHYGVSPDNLFIFPDGTMKLGGFCIGSVRRTEQDFAPELFAGCAALEQYTPDSPLTEATDVYGVTACLFYALTGTLPQDADRRKYDQRLLIANAMLEVIPPFVVNVLAAGLQVYADKRPQTLAALRAKLDPAPEEAAPAAAPAAEKPKTSDESEPKMHARLPDFMAALIAFFVSAAILGHVLVNYVKNDPDYPYIDFGGSHASSMDSSSAESGSASDAESDASSEETVSSEAPEETSSAIPEGWVEIPNYGGMKFTSIPQNGTFRVLRGEDVFSDEYAEGEVVSQNLTGYAMPGSAIAVTVSKGPLQRAMPNIVGMPQDKAQAELAVSGFVMGKITKERNDGLPNGTVIRFTDTSVKAGEKYDYGTVVELTVSYRTDPETD